MSASLQFDDLREQREYWREWLEWVREMEQWHKEETLGWGWGSTTRGVCVTDISED